jgi:FkbM family methyltransferase
MENDQSTIFSKTLAKHPELLHMKTFFTLHHKIIRVIKNPLKYWNFYYARVLEYVYAYIDSRKVRSVRKCLFLDCGSNVGQGFRWFRNFYKSKNVNFELFEPNPNCWNALAEICSNDSSAKLNKSGVWIENTTRLFYGTGEDEGGKTTEAGSIVKEHNTAIFSFSEDNAFKVKLIDFSELLQKKSKEYDWIVVKMDIEGAEIELLEYLIQSKCIGLINVLYVEFHSMYQVEPQRGITKLREYEIVKAIKRANVALRLWH